MIDNINRHIARNIVITLICAVIVVVGIIIGYLKPIGILAIVSGVVIFTGYVLLFDSTMDSYLKYRNLFLSSKLGSERRL